MGKCNVSYNSTAIVPMMALIARKYTDSKNVGFPTGLNEAELEAMYTELMDVLNSKFFHNNIHSSLDAEDFPDIWRTARTALAHARMDRIGDMIHDEVSPVETDKMIIESYRKKIKPAPPTKPSVNPTPGGGQLEFSFTDPLVPATSTGKKKKVVGEDISKKDPAVTSQTEESTTPEGENNTNTESEDAYSDGLMQMIAREKVKAVKGKYKSIPHIIEEYLGEEDAVFQEDFINFYLHTVAKNWISTKVENSGAPIGYRDLEETHGNILRTLTHDIFAAFQNSSIGVYAFSDPMNLSAPPAAKLLLLDPMTSTKDLSLSGTLGKNGEFGKIYIHNTVKATNGVNGRMAVIIPTEEGIKDPSSMSLLVDAYLSDTLKLETLTTEDLEGWDSIYEPNPQRVPLDAAHAKYIQFANILNSELDSMLAHYHPGILKSHEEKYRKGYTTNDGSVSASDQDSKRIKMSKETTPRLVLTGEVKGVPRLVQDVNNPYLTAQEFNSISQRIINNATSTREVIDFLRRHMALEGDPNASLYASIYYRFFADEDYLVDEYDPIKKQVTSEVRHRSLNDIAKLHGYKGTELEKISNLQQPKTLTESLKSVDKKHLNSKLNDVVAAMTTSLFSNVPYERVRYEGDEATITNTRGGDVLARFHSDMMHRIAYPETKSIKGVTERSYILQPKVTNKLNRKSKIPKLDYVLSKDAGGPIVTFKIYNDDRKETITIVARVNMDDDGHGIPLTILEMKQLPEATLRSVFKSLGLPSNLFERDIYKNIKKELIENEDRPDLHTKDLPLENFLVNVMYQIARANKNKGVLAGPVNKTLWGYDNIMIRAFTPIYGSEAKQFIRSYDNDKLAVQAPVSKIRKFHTVREVARRSGGRNMSAGSYIVRGGIQLGNAEEGTAGIYSKMGFKQRHVVKGNYDLSELESIDYLVQRAYMQRMTQGKPNYTNALLQIGAMSDRTDIPLLDFKGVERTADGYVVFPTKGENLDRDVYKAQFIASTGSYHRQLQGAILRNWKQVLIKHDIETKNIKNINDLVKALDKAKLPYNKISKEESLIKNAQVGKRTIIVKGKEVLVAYIPEGVVSSINVFQSPKERTLVDAWNNMLKKYIPETPHIETIEELQGYLEEATAEDGRAKRPVGRLELMYEDLTPEVRQELGMSLGNVGIDKSDVVVSKDKVHEITSLKGNKLAADYLETMRLQYREHLTDVGFTPDKIEDITVRQLAKKIPKEIGQSTKKSVSKAARRKAYDVLTDSYFYNQATLGQEALRLYTGGNLQFKAAKADSAKGKMSYFNLTAGNSLKEDGSIDADAVIATAENVLRLREKWTPNSKQSKVKKPELDALIKKYGKEHRFVWMQKVLDAKFKTGTSENKEEIAKTLVMDDIATMSADSFIDQVKRNASIGTTGQSPTIIGDNDYGLKLTSHSKNITFEDPHKGFKIGGLPIEAYADIYDAVQMGHPLYFRKLNNSLGNSESNFSFSGTPVKDITNGVTREGFTIFQKKATFDMFNNEILRKGTPELENLLIRMNTAVTFGIDGEGVDIMVPATFADGEMTNPDTYTNPLTASQWIKNGVALGVIFDSHTGKTISAEQLLEDLNATKDENAFLKAIKDERYFTNRVEKRFKNLQELWEHFGSTANDQAWDDVGFIVGNYAGQSVPTGNITLNPLILADAHYTLRDSYIEKAGFKTQEKSGSHNLMDAEDLTNPTQIGRDASFRNPDGTPRFYPVSNENHLIILQSEHESDTTAKAAAQLGLDYGEDIQNNTVALITQIISANINQGRSVAESKRIGLALQTLSETMVDMLKNDIKVSAKQMAVEAGAGSTVIAKIEKYFDDPKKKDADIDVFIKQAYRESAKKMLVNTLKTQEDPGVVSDLIDMDSDGSLSFDLKQIQPLVQSVIFSKFNKEGVRYRFAGGQFVVAPSEHFIRTYKFGGIKNLTREELNQKLYHGGILEADLEQAGFGLAPVTAENIKQHTTTDSVVSVTTGDINILKVAKGTVLTLHEAKYLTRQSYKESYGDFEAYFQRVLEQNFETRISGIGAIESKSDDSKEEGLKWIEYTNKNGLEFKETDEFLSYQMSHSIPENHDAIVKEYNKVPDREIGLGSFAFLRGDKIEVPKGLVKMFYFSDVISPLWQTGSTPLERGGENATDILLTEWSPQEEARFEEWYTAQQADEDSNKLLSEAIYHFAVQHGKKYTKHLRVKVEDILRDDGGEHNWTVNLAEFYLPSMHKSMFLIKDGETMHDYEGDQVQPDVNTLVSLGLFTRAQAFDIDKNFDTKKIKKIFEEKEATTLTPDQVNTLKIYKDRKHEQLEYLRYKYQSKVADFIKETGLFDLRHIVEKAIEKDRSVIDSLITTAMYERSKVPYGNLRVVGGKTIKGSAIYTAWDQIIDELYVIKDNKEVSADADLLRKKLNVIFAVNDTPNVNPTAIDNFIATKANILASNFNVAREFIAARIPAQGKQSYIAGRIKNFVDSTKNSIYGPIEMLIITGADHDIDKVNNMTWAVDRDGRIVDWKDYTAHGSVTEVPLRSSLITRIAEGEKSIEEVYEGKLARATDPARIKTLEEEKSNMFDVFEKEEYENFAKAVQNTVVFNLLETIKDPINAMEAATPVSTENVSSSMQKEDYTQLKTNDKSATYLKARKHMFAQDPAAIMRYEAINGAGKRAIGTFASDLKAYDTVYAAVLDSAEPGEVKFISTTTQYARLPLDRGDKPIGANRVKQVNEYLAKAGVKERVRMDAIQFIKFVDGKPVVQHLETIANAGYMRGEGETKELVTYGKARREIKDLRKEIANLSTEAEQVAMILEHTKELEAFNSMQVEAQAWADLSELLTAATDNAKELILARIGANNTTNSIISTMVRMGVSLTDSINLIQEITNHKKPEIRNIFKSVENHNDIRYKPVRGEKTYSTVSEAIKKALGKSGTASGRALVENPLYRLLPFVQIQSEFSTWSRIVSVNQGLKIRDYDAWKWVKGIEQDIITTVRDYEEIHGSPDNSTEFDFSLETFVKEAKIAKGNWAGNDYILDIVTRYNDAKSGVNVPFVLFKSSQFFSYITAMFDAKHAVAQVSEIAEINDGILDRVLDAQQIKVNKIKEEDFGRLRDYIHGVGVVMYFNANVENGKIENLYGEDFNLTTKEGRLRFVEMMPYILESAVEDHEKNDKGYSPFLSSLRSDTSVLDYSTQKEITIVAGPDVKNIPVSKAAELKLSANRLGKINKKLHRALFLYSLIVNKGQYGGNSFASLMGVENFKSYSKFLRENIQDVKENVEDFSVGNFEDPRYLRLLLNNPVLITEVDTSLATGLSRSQAYITKQENKAASKDPEYAAELQAQKREEAANRAEEATHGDEEGIKTRKKSWYEKRREDYYLDNLRNEKIRDKNNKIPDIIRSKQTDMIYRWNSELLSWIPYIQRDPDQIIPYSSYSSDITQMTGFDYGWEVVDGANKVTIFAFVDDDLVTKIENKTLKLTIPKTAQGDKYIVKVNDGDYQIWDADTIRNHIDNVQNDLILDGPRMGMIYSAGVRTPTIERTAKYWMDGNYRLHTKQDNNKKYLPKIFSVRPLDLATEQTSAVYDPVYFKEIREAFAASHTLKDFSLADVNRAYEEVRRALIFLELKSNPKVTRLLTQDHYIESIVNSKGGGSQKANYDAAVEVTNILYPENPDALTKIRLVKLAERAIKIMYTNDKVEGLADVALAKLDAIDLPGDNEITATLELLDSPNRIKSMSIGDLDIFLTDDIGHTKFGEYINTVLLQDGKYHFFERESTGRVYVAKGVAQDSVSEKIFKEIIKVSEGDTTNEQAKNQLVMPTSSMRDQSKRTTSKKVFRRLVNHLNDIFPGTEFRTSDTKGLETVYGIKDASKTRAFVKDGIIIFNLDLVDLGTPFHEYAHVYFEHLKKENRALFDKLIEDALTSPLAPEVSEAYKHLNLSKEDLGEEILAEIVSRKVKGKLANDDTFRRIEANLSGSGKFSKIVRFFKRVVTSAFGIDTSRPAADYSLSLNDSLETTMEKIGDKMIFGEGSILSDFLPTTIEMVKLARQGSKMNMKEAKNALVEAGFIQYVCS